MKINKIGSFFSGFLVLFILYDILALSTYNNDWDAYEQMYLGVFESRDFFFQFLISIANSFGLTYSQFYTYIQSFIYIICVFFCQRFVRKGLFLLLGVLLIIASPNLPILIRYYLAFSIFLLSNITYLKGYKILTFVLMILSFFTHSAIIICFPIYIAHWFIVKKGTDKIYKKILTIAIIIGGVKILIIDFLNDIGLNVFSSYTSDIASFASTFFMDCIYFSWFCTCYYIHLKLKKSYLPLNNDKRYLFLYSSVLYPLLFIFISNIMIVQFRLYEPFILLSLIYMLYVKNNYLNNKRWITNVILYLLLLSFLMKYVILGVLTNGISEWFIHYSEIILSNDRSIILKLI